MFQTTNRITSSEFFGHDSPPWLQRSRSPNSRGMTCTCQMVQPCSHTWKCFMSVQGKSLHEPTAQHSTSNELRNSQHIQRSQHSLAHDFPSPGTLGRFAPSSRPDCCCCQFRPRCCSKKTARGPACPWSRIKLAGPA